MDILEELMEEWKEDKSSESTIAFEDNFDAEKDLREIERLLEEAEFEELIRISEKSTRRVEEPNSTSWGEKTRSDGNFGLDSTCSVYKTRI